MTGDKRKKTLNRRSVHFQQEAGRSDREIERDRRFHWLACTDGSIRVFRRSLPLFPIWFISACEWTIWKYRRFGPNRGILFSLAGKTALTIKATCNSHNLVDCYYWDSSKSKRNKRLLIIICYCKTKIIKRKERKGFRKR